MKLLLDEIREHGVLTDPFQEIHLDWSAVDTVINRIAGDERVQVFDVSPAGEKYLSGELRIEELPGFRLPYSASWFEVHEKFTPSTKHLVSKVSWGMYVEEIDAADWDRAEMATGVFDKSKLAYFHFGMLFVSWGDARDAIPGGPVASWVLPLAADGTFLPPQNSDDKTKIVAMTLVPTSETIVQYCREHKMNTDQEIQMFLAANYIFPLYAGVGLLNFRNISTEIVTTPPKLQHARVKRKKPPFVSYHTLVVSPLVSGKRYDRKGGPVSTGHTMPFHMVRGHPATYSADAPRFGRKSDGVGTFWIKGHPRGLKSTGQTRKDYAVDPATDRKTRLRTIPRTADYQGPSLWKELVRKAEGEE